MKTLKKIVSLLFDFERRRIKRIPCKIRAHFCMMGRECNDRGEATLTDITREGFCCDNLHFFRHDPQFTFKINHELDFYFSLPINSESKINFEAKGRIRSIMQKDMFGHNKRFGIKLGRLKKGTRKEFLACIQYLSDLAENEKPYQQF
jgi:hypothetical protein